MQTNRTLDGRFERRFPIVVVVRLSRPGSLASGEEVAYTDNISAHGARVVSSHPWRPGEQAQVAPLNEERPIRGEVVYCQSVANARFCAGFRFQEKLEWSVLERYDGA